MGMPERKPLKWADGFGTDADPPAGQPASRVTVPEAAANDADGWEHYRRWVSKAPAPQSRRTGIDPSLYTWRGYRSWTEQVRRNWAPESADDAD